MIFFRLFLRTFAILFIALIGVPNALHAQQQTYKGPYKIGKYQGDATYEYLLKDGDTIFDGAFQVQKSDLEALLEKEDSSFGFFGAFKNGYASDTWQFRFGSFRSGSESEVVNYQYRVNINGLEEEIVGKMVSGKPNGPWTITVNRIENSKVAQTAFKSKIDFENGISTGSFRVENEQLALVGRFLRNGMAHDEWTIYGSGDDENEENWFFKEGILESVRFKDANGMERVLRFDGNKNVTLKVLPLDKGYLNVLEVMAPTADSTVLAKSGLPGLLLQNSGFYRRVDTILRTLGTTDFYPKWYAKLPYYGLTEVEEKMLAAIKERSIAAKTISDRLLNDSRVILLKRSDDAVDYDFAVVRAISEHWLPALDQLRHYQEQGVVGFMERKRLLAALFPSDPPSVPINISAYRDSSATKTTFALGAKTGYTGTVATLSELDPMSRYALESLRTIDDRIRKKLGRDDNRDALQDVEAELVDWNEKIQRYIDSLGNRPPKEHRKALAAIQEFGDKQLSDYVALTDSENKQATARSLAVCFKKLYRLSREVGLLEQRSDSIKKHYSDGVWNPFVAVVMEENVKKRITSAYNNVLTPHFLDRVQNGLDCERLPKLLLLMERTYQRMFALRDEDTKKLERKLRRADDALEVLRLFNIENPVIEK